MPSYPVIKAALARLAEDHELASLGLPGVPRPPVLKRVLGGVVASAAAVQPAILAIAKARSARRSRLLAAAFERLHPVGRQDWAISCPLSIGDVYLYASFAKALLACRGGRRVVFFTKPEHAFIPRLFPSVSESVGVAPPFVPQDIGRKPGKTWLDSHEDRGRARKPGWGGLDMLGYRGISFVDCVRADLRLPPGAEPERPSAPGTKDLADACEWLRSKGLEPGRVALLSPDSTATRGLPRIPDMVWAGLIDAFHERGIRCVTNLGGPASRVLDGAPGLPVPLERLRAVACAAGFVVANRSGICDLVCDLPLTLAVLFPAADYRGGRLFPATSLRAMNWEGARFVEQEVDCNRAEPALGPLLAALQLR